jgi:hypothetical protein
MSNKYAADKLLFRPKPEETPVSEFRSMVVPDQVIEKQDEVVTNDTVQEDKV